MRPSAIMYLEGSERRICRPRRYEVGPVPLLYWYREINRCQFSFSALFGILREKFVEGMPHGWKTCEESFASLWKYCGSCKMVALTVLRPG